jgi:pyruvate kinase
MLYNRVSGGHMANFVDILKVGDQLESLHKRALEFEARFSDELALVHPDLRQGAKNLVHYLALRQSDIRALQEDLAALGLASLGRAEHDVMASIHAIQSAMSRSPRTAEYGENEDLVDLIPSKSRTDEHRKAVLGRCPDERDTSIMVTLPTEAASDDLLIPEMLAAGMNIARINCAHDDKIVWSRMIKKVKNACENTESECRIFMDLAGPKIRTGDLEPGPRVIHIRPRRDPLGRILASRHIRFIPEDVVWGGMKAEIIPVPRECIEYAHVGDEIRFKDTRGKKRRLAVVQKDDKGLVLESYKGAYIATGTKLRLHRTEEGEKLSYRVGELPIIEQPILLRPGDTFILHGRNIPGAAAVEGDDGQVIKDAHISCRQPEVFEFVAAGDRISLNDGKIEGVVQTVSDDQIETEITKAKATGSRLRSNRGINFPDSDICIPGLTASDKENLKFVTKHADAVGLSFVRTPVDVELLQAEMGSENELGLVLKIETRKGFKNLPRLLLTAMQHYPVAVMIARGDLAVECGWERLAELQEEILWICEAAQVPVIWATQVLELNAKKGQPSRAEISDAAMSEQADCVMLNKGPHIIATIRMLDKILRRMRGHQHKRATRLKKLSLS